MVRLLLLAPLTVLFGVLATGCGTNPTTFVPSVKAPPQQATLDWVEQYPAEKPALVFGVRSFAVTEDGWRATISVENRSDVGWEVGAQRLTVERAFGVLLFPNDDLDELERRNREGTLPALRRATAYVPPLPQVLEPGTTWSGTISAPGPLAGGLWLRISFGTFTSVGDPPEGAQPQLVWFTDHAYRLEEVAADGA
jgi:hypothetical protein